MSPSQFQTCADIIISVCAHFQIRPQDLESPCRQWRLVWPRWIVITLIRRETNASVITLGHMFNRTPGAITRALQGLEWEIQSNCSRAREVATIARALAVQSSKFKVQGSKFPTIARALPVQSSEFDVQGSKFPTPL